MKDAELALGGEEEKVMLSLTMRKMSPAELDRAIRQANLRMAWRLRFWYSIEARERLEKTMREESTAGPGKCQDRYESVLFSCDGHTHV